MAAAGVQGYPCPAVVGVWPEGARTLTAGQGAYARPAALVAWPEGVLTWTAGRTHPPPRLGHGPKAIYRWQRRVGVCSGQRQATGREARVLRLPGSLCSLRRGCGPRGRYIFSSELGRRSLYGVSACGMAGRSLLSCGPPRCDRSTAQRRLAYGSGAGALPTAACRLWVRALPEWPQRAGGPASPPRSIFGPKARLRGQRGQVLVGVHALENEASWADQALLSCARRARHMARRRLEYGGGKSVPAPAAMVLWPEGASTMAAGAGCQAGAGTMGAHTWCGLPDDVELCPPRWGYGLRARLSWRRG